MDGPTAKATEKIAKKTREEKLREQKIESEILKSLNAISEPEQKFQTLLHRCVEAERISRSAQLQQKQNQKTIETLLLEKDNLGAEYQRVMLTKSKLESLCRELQNQNKTIKEDSLSKIREEEERRKETQAKFQHSLNEIQKLMNENSEKNKKLETDNQEMSMKFKNILAQYEEREKQMDRINKQMELVTQLNEAKLQKSNIESLAEKESFLKQCSILEDTIIILKRQLQESLGSEKALQAQVDLYSSKYGEFTKTFQGYKTDMTKMSKKTFKMEKEMLQWKIKYEKANAMLLDLISEKQVRDEHITKTAKQLFHLQKLCRTLSAEKKAFYGKLVECNIDIPAVKEEEVPMPVPVVPEVVPEKGPDKLDEMMKSRDELKKNLNQLQSQLSTAQLEDDVGAGKKSKSKKSKKGKHVENGVKNEPQPADEVKANGVEIVNGNAEKTGNGVEVIGEPKDVQVIKEAEAVKEAATESEAVQVTKEPEAVQVVPTEPLVEPTTVPATPAAAAVV